MPERTAVILSTLLAGSALLSGCGPQSTVLIATGPFANRDVRDFDANEDPDGAHRLAIALSGNGDASLRLTARPAEASCWKSIDSEHACTERTTPGVLDEALFLVSNRTCAVNGWIENLGGVWQLDLTIEPSGDCDEGHFAATIAP